MGYQQDFLNLHDPPGRASSLGRPNPVSYPVSYTSISPKRKLRNNIDVIDYYAGNRAIMKYESRPKSVSLSVKDIDIDIDIADILGHKYRQKRYCPTSNTNSCLSLSFNYSTKILLFIVCYVLIFNWYYRSRLYSSIINHEDISNCPFRLVCASWYGLYVPNTITPKSKTPPSQQIILTYMWSQPLDEVSDHLWRSSQSQIADWCNCFLYKFITVQM